MNTSARMHHALAERKRFVRTGFHRLGFGDDRLTERFSVFTGSTGEKAVLLADTVAFTVPSPRDASTAAAVVSYATDDTARADLLRAARALAAPLSLLAGPEGLLVVPTFDPDVAILEAGYSESWTYSLEGRITPEVLQAAKRGNWQGSLFPATGDELVRVRSQQEDRLAPLVTEALRLASSGSGSAGAQAGARLVGAALCAMVLADKTDLERGDPRVVLAAAADQFPSLVGPALRDNRDRLGELVAFLGAEARFDSIDNTVISRVYERVLVTPEQRKRLGIHYTDSRLAAKILADVPIESIPPQRRQVLDPACGSGSLLIAAHDRLNGLQPAYWDEGARHRELVASLTGYDADPFAVEMSKVALSLHAIPQGNGWHVETRDTPASAIDGPAPGLIVANPPFNLPNGTARDEAAAQFMNWIVRRLDGDGLFAVILPASWLSGYGSTRESRELVDRKTDVFQVWRLPRFTFNSKATTAVLFGRRLRDDETKTRRPAVSVHVVNQDALNGFYEGTEGPGRPKALVADGLSAPRPVHSALNDVPGLAPLSTVARVRTGAQPMPGHLQAVKSGAVSGDVPWLPALRNVPHYAPVPQNLLLHTPWPEPFLVNIKSDDVFGAKVLVGTQLTDDYPWLRAVIDEDGVLGPKGALWVVPLQPDNRSGGNHLSRGRLARALLAVMASGLASAWVGENLTGRNVPGRTLSGLLVPVAREAWDALAEAGDMLVAAVESRTELGAILREVDQRVSNVYGLSPAASAAVTDRLAGVPDPALGREPRYHLEEAHAAEPTAQEETLERDGCVLDVDSGRVRLWVPGVTEDDGDWVPLPHGMNGWLARPGSTFRVLLNEADHLATGVYLPHRVSWFVPDDEPSPVASR